MFLMALRDDNIGQRFLIHIDLYDLILGNHVCYFY